MLFRIALVVLATCIVPSCAASRSAGLRIQEGGPRESDATESDARPVVREHGGIRRSRSRDGAHLLLRTSMDVGDWHIGLVGSPDVRTERVGLTVTSPHLSSLFDEHCELRVMVDGSLLGVLEQERFQRAHGSHPAMLAVRLPLTRLVAMAAGDRVAMRVCGEEIRLGLAERARFAEFLLQYEEEHRWADPVEPQDLTALPSEPAQDEPPSPSAP